MRVCKYGHKGWWKGGVRHAEEGGGYHGERRNREEEGRLPCRLQGIKTSEIYSSLDWSGLARFGVASSKKGAILLVTSNEGAVALQGCAVLLFADFNKTVLKIAAYMIYLSIFIEEINSIILDILNNHEDVYFKTKHLQFGMESNLMK